MRTESARAPGREASQVFCAVGVLSIGLAWLILTASPSGSWRDVSEFQWAAAVLGVPHPPGSPIHMIVGRLMSLVPFGSIAWRINLLSACTGAVGLALAYVISSDLLRVVAPGADPRAARLLAFTAPIALLGSPVYRQHAATAEVYAMQAACAGGILWCQLRIAANPDRSDLRPLAITVFLTALATGVHVSFAFNLVALVAWGLVRHRGHVGSRGVSLIASAIVLGSGVFLYVPLRASAGPSINWGDPVTLDRLRYHLTDQKDWEHHGEEAAARPDSQSAPAGGAERREEPGLLRSTAASASAASSSTLMWCRFLHGYVSAQVGVLGEALALVGLGIVLARAPGAGSLLLLFGLAHLAFAIPIGKWANPTGYNPIYLIVAACSSVPIGALLEWQVVRRAPVAAAAISLALVAILAARIPSGAGGEPLVDDWRSDDLTRAMLRPVEPDSILLAAHLWPLFGYLREVEGYRTDVDVIFRNEVYETQRMRLDPARIHDVVIPTSSRLDNKVDRVIRMARFLEMNHEAGRPIAWQSEADDLFFPVRPAGLLFSYAGPLGPRAELEPAPNTVETLDGWLSSFEPGGSRRDWLREDDDVEEAVLPAARFVAWSAARHSCDRAGRWWQRVVAVLGSHASGIPWTHGLDTLVRECQPALPSSTGAGDSAR